MASGEIAPRLCGAHAPHGRKSVSAALVVIEIRAERLLEREALDIRLELRPAMKTQLTRELELHVRQLHLPPRGTALAYALLCLLAQLLKIELKRHRGSLPSRRASAGSGWRGSSVYVLKDRG